MLRKLLILSFLAFTPACGDDSKSTDAATDAASDAASETAGDAASENSPDASDAGSDTSDGDAGVSG